MIFTQFNVILFGVLLVVNLIPIYFSKRSKRFAYFSTKIFLLIFIAYWVTLLAYFQTIDFANTTAIIHGKTSALTETEYASKILDENNAIHKFKTLNTILTAAIVQSIIVILLALFGIIWLNERVRYYIWVSALFIAVCILCGWVLKNGTITGYVETAQ